VASYVFVIAALIWWKRPKAEASALNEQFFGAFRAGIRYARSSRELHVVLLRAAVFFLFASSVWALLPLVARRMLGGSAGFYGVMLGAVGAGAILGALLLPRLRQKLDADGLVLLSSVLSAAVMAALSLAPPQWAAVLLMLVLGLGWIIALTTLTGVAQAVLPNWVRGRGLAVYLMVFNGAMAAGSLGWGLVAREIGVPYALAVSAAGLVAVALLFHRASLPVGEADLQASNHWPEPLLAEPVAHDRGPVLVQVEYRIRQEDRPAFLDAMQRLSQERLRDGAYAWGVVEHTNDPQRVVEWFFVESWAEHLRQHHRVSHADADLQAEALRFHMGPDKPEVHHFLALKR
jgi:quinol monooxygenase YgiN